MDRARRLYEELTREIEAAADVEWGSGLIPARISWPSRAAERTVLEDFDARHGRELRQLALEIEERDLARYRRFAEATGDIPLLYPACGADWLPARAYSDVTFLDIGVPSSKPQSGAFVRGDMASMPVKSGSVSIVLVKYPWYFEKIEDYGKRGPEDLAAEIDRVLLPGGWFLSVPEDRPEATLLARNGYGMRNDRGPPLRPEADALVFYGALQASPLTESVAVLRKP